MVDGGSTGMDGHLSPSPQRLGRVRAELKTPSPVSGGGDGESTDTRKHSPWTAPRQRKKQFVRRESSSPQKFPTSFPINCGGDVCGTPKQADGERMSSLRGPWHEGDELGELSTPTLDKENYDEGLGEDDPAWRASMMKRRSRSFSGAGSLGELVGNGQEWVRHSNPEPVSMVHDHCGGVLGGGVHVSGEDQPAVSQCRLHGGASCHESARFCEALRDGARRCGVEHAEDMIMSRWESDVPPSADVYHTLLELWDDAGDVERLRDVVGRMWALGSRCSAVSPTVSTYTMLLRGHVRQYGPGAAEALLTEMADLGLDPDAGTYNALLRGYAELGDAEGAEGVLVEMGRAGVQPNASTYHYVAGACLRAEQLGLGEGAAPDARP